MLLPIGQSLPSLKGGIIMDTLKKIFPLSWKYTNGAGNLVVGILIYIVIGILGGAVLSLSGLITGWIPVVGAIIGWALRVIGALVDVWVVAGIVIQILVFCKVIKD